jgi:hypothetical protein
MKCGGRSSCYDKIYGALLSARAAQKLGPHSSSVLGESLSGFRPALSRQLLAASSEQPKLWRIDDCDSEIDGR